MIWGIDQVDWLKDLCAKKWTAAQIAAHMGISRNAVIGKADRLGLSLNKQSAPLFWNEQRVAELRRLCADEKLSASQMAAAFGCSRNAVLGAARRNKIDLPFVAMRSAPPRRVVGLPPTKRALAEQSAASKHAPINVSFADLRKTSCRWITNDDLQEPLYCGHDAVIGTDWCPHHYCIVYTPVAARTAARMAA